MIACTYVAPYLFLTDSTLSPVSYPSFHNRIPYYSIQHAYFSLILLVNQAYILVVDAQ